MAGRPKGAGAGVRLTDSHRAKIRAVNIINALQEHVEGAREMSSSQVTAGLGLLKKVMPDISENRFADADGKKIEFRTIYEAK